MTRRRTALLLLLIVVAIGAGLYVWFRHGLVDAPEANTQATPADPGRIEEVAPYYEITATYPIETPINAKLGDRADKIAVGLMKGFINTAIDQFKIDGDFKNITQEDIEMFGYSDERKQSLQISHLSSVSENTISYIFTINAYQLGAHGNTYYKTFTFSLVDGSTLKLGDLFLSNASYLDAVSSTTRAALPGILGESTETDSMRTGTAPVETNFENFFLDDSSLVILFAPYAVAPYSAGTQTVAIPRSELADILKPEYK